jgi:Ni/Co efflux regulator RcnB
MQLCLLFLKEFTMKKIISALVSAAFLASPMLVISTSASATTMSPTSTASSFKVDAKRGGKKGMKRGAKKAKAA